MASTALVTVTMHLPPGCPTFQCDVTPALYLILIVALVGQGLCPFHRWGSGV